MIGAAVLFGPAMLFAEDAPIRVNVGKGYNRVYNYYYPKIIVTSAVDMITIKDIVVNKGNCSYDKSDMAYRNGQVVAVFNAYKNCFDDMRKYAPLLNLLKFGLKTAIGTVQPVRNEASHGGSTSRDECERVREQLMGVGMPSVLSAMLAQRAEMDR